MSATIGQQGVKRRYWTLAEVRKLRRLYPNMENEALGKRLHRPWYSVQNKANKLGLRKTAAFMATVCRFQQGHASWNKGTHWTAGGRSALTRFRKGNRPQTWLPVGSERVNRDGTLERKVRNPGAWKPVKDILWQEARGRIPRGHFVVHKDRDRSNFALPNLELVDRAENMRRNTYHRYPKEIARLIQLRGALNRQINKRAKHEHDSRAA